MDNLYETIVEVPTRLVFQRLDTELHRFDRHLPSVVTDEDIFEDLMNILFELPFGVDIEKAQRDIVFNIEELTGAEIGRIEDLVSDLKRIITLTLYRHRIHPDEFRFLSWGWMSTYVDEYDRVRPYNRRAGIYVGRDNGR